MDPISSLASILQLLGNAASAATSAARFINNVRGASQIQSDWQSRLELLQGTLSILEKKLAKSRQRRQNSSDGSDHSVNSGMSNISSDINYKPEVKEIEQTAKKISEDCKSCAMRLKQLTDGPTNTMWNRVRGQLRQEIHKPEIQRVEAKIQTNVGNIQLLVGCLQLFFDDDQVSRREHIDQLLLDMRERSQEFRDLRDSIASLLQRPISNDDGNTENDGNQQFHSQPLAVIPALDQDEDWIQTTNQAIEMAESLITKLSFGASEYSQASHYTESHEGYSVSSNGGIPIPPETPHPSSEPAELSREAPHLQSDILTTLLDRYIHKAYEEFKQCQYDKCERYLHSAIECGEERYRAHRQVFEQWFELKIKLAETYMMQGNISEAKSLISDLNQPYQADYIAEYREITPFRRAQLYHAQAKFSLHGYHKYHDITLPNLLTLAQNSYSVVADLVNSNVEGLPDADLVQLAKECAEIWSKVACLQGDEVAADTLRKMYSSPKKNLVSDTKWQTNSWRGHQINGPSADVARRSTISSSPSEQAMSQTEVQSSETALTETSWVPSQSTCASVDKGYEYLRRHMNCAPINVKERNSYGLTPLLIAAKRADLRSIQLLLEHSADVNSQDDQGMNALHHLLRRVDCDKEIVRLLLSRNIDVNAANDNGETPLHYCVMFRHRPAAFLILESDNESGKVDIEKRNKSDKTAATLAASHSGSYDIQMLRLLHRYGAKFDTAVIPRDMWPVIEKLSGEGRRRRSTQSTQSDAISTQSSRRSRLSLSLWSNR